MEEDKHFKLFKYLQDLFPEPEIKDYDRVEACLKLLLKKGSINLDFIDEDNWDRIVRFALDRNNNLLYLYYHEPKNGKNNQVSNDNSTTCALVVSLQCIEIVQDKTYGPIAVAIKGRNVQSKALKKLMSSNGYAISSIDSSTEFFADDVVREKNGVKEYIRFLNTPIISFWIIDKSFYIHPQDSLKALYIYNLHLLEMRTNVVESDLISIQQKSYTGEILEDKICASGNTLRRIAESFFKLMLSYHIDKIKRWDKFKCEDYNKYYLGDLETLLKGNVFSEIDDKTRIHSIVTDANELSHDTGHPVELSTATRLLTDIRHYFNVFRGQVKNNDRDKHLHELVPKKPSPESFIIQKWSSWDFHDLLSCQPLQQAAKIAYSITFDIGFMHSIFEPSRSLAADGKIFEHDLFDKEKQILIGNRQEAIRVCDEINNRVSAMCKNEGYDDESVSLFFHASIERNRIEYPTRLFTIQDIRDVLKNADTTHENWLVVDEDGKPSLLSERKLAMLYPVRSPWWEKGSIEIGKNVTDDVVEHAYRKALCQWYVYITCDLDITADGLEDNTDNMIKTIKQVCKL